MHFPDLLPGPSSFSLQPLHKLPEYLPSMSTPEPAPLLRHTIRVDVVTFDNDKPRLIEQVADAIADSPVVQMATQVFVSCPSKTATGTGSQKAHKIQRPSRKEYRRMLKRLTEVLDFTVEPSLDDLATLVVEAKRLAAK